MVNAAPDLSPRYVLDFSSLPDFGPLPLVETIAPPETLTGRSPFGILLMSLPFVVGLIVAGLMWSMLFGSAVSRSADEPRIGAVDQAVALDLRPTLR